MEWRSAFLVLGFLGLCFLGIPIKINKPDLVETGLLFSSYLKKFNKSYHTNSTEYELRFRHFKESLSAIALLNDHHGSEGSAIYGLTQFSDLSQEEFRNRHLRPHYHQRLRKHPHHHIASFLQDAFHHNRHRSKRAVPLPDKMDWREKGVVTSVKNQKSCGACWAFSTVETVESMRAIKTGVLESLSVQEIIDCAQNGNFGCDGGDTCSLLDWLTQNKIKIEPETAYPLVLKTEACRLKGPEFGVQLSPSYSCDYLVGNEEAILETLARHGPVAVAVNALSWQYYLGGVIQYHCDGSPSSMNHAVQIVGYDRTGAVPHYIIRNSWGTAFGDRGYLKLAIGANICGVGTEVTALDVL